MIILIIIAIISFLATIIFRHISDSKALISMAIGCAINANIYNSNNMPISWHGLVFGIDSILYTLFICTIIYKAIDYTVEEAWDMTISTIIAIIISSFIELFANWSYQGLDQAEIVRFLGYIFSALGTYLGVKIMFIYYRAYVKRHPSKDSPHGFLKNLICMLICISLASLINSLIYFYGNSIATFKFTHFITPNLLASFIGKLFSSLLGLAAYIINAKYLKANYKN